MRHALPVALTLALASCASRAPLRAAAPGPAAGAPPAEAPPALVLPDGVRPLHYALALEVVPGREGGFTGSCEIEVELATARSFVWLPGRGLRVSRATVEAPGTGERPATFTQVSDEGVAKVAFEAPVGPGRVVLRLAWQASWGTNLAGLYLAREGNETYAATQLEAIYARRIFPGFDEPRFKTPFDVTLTVPAEAVAVSTAPAVAEEPAGAGLRRVRFATTEPLPTYLLFVGVGPFDVVTPPPLPPNEVRHRPLPVRLLAPRGHGRELAFAAETTAALVPWFERYFAIPFPYAKLDQIAIPAFAAGGMENAGAIAYRSSFLLDSAGTSEADRFTSAAVIAHEVAHEWFGDLVTLPWWTDTWLNESFATWIGGKAMLALWPAWSPLAPEIRHLDQIMRLDAAESARAIRQPLLAMSDVWSQFDGMSYEKGAAVLRTFEGLAGGERFRDGIRAYLAAHRHGTGAVEDLYAELSRAAGRPLGAAFADFTDAAGVPLVSARVRCEAGRARLALSQDRFVPRGSDAPRGQLWRVPVCARWETGGLVQEGCTLLDGAEGALELGAGCPRWVMPHAEAASYHRWALAPADLARLRERGLSKLTAVEKISLARNLRAAQQAGVTPWATAMEGIAALARDPDPDVALEAADVVALAEDRLVPDRERPAAAAFARRLYGPVFARLGWTAARGDSLGRRRLREASLEALVIAGRDRAVRGEAARRGRALLGLDGPPRAGAVDPGLAELAIAAAIGEGGAPAFDAVVARLAGVEDAALREKIVSALGRQDDPALAGRAAALWRGAVRPHEVRYLFSRLGQRAAGRAALLAEVAGSFDALAAALPDGTTSYLPFQLSRGCDVEFAEQLRRALEPHLAAHPGMRRPLAQALEQVRICTAERQADGTTAGAFFVKAVRGAGSAPAVRSRAAPGERHGRRTPLRAPAGVEQWKASGRRCDEGVTPGATPSRADAPARRTP